MFTLNIFYLFYLQTSSCQSAGSGTTDGMCLTFRFQQKPLCGLNKVDGSASAALLTLVLR